MIGRMRSTAVSPNIKSTGAYYTDLAVARFLTNWAVTDAADSVLDPSCGGGVFLQAAAERLLDLGGDPGRQVFGFDVDPAAIEHAARDLAPHVKPANLTRSDFFDVDAGEFDAVVGNPPFIRYQTFGGDARAKARARAASLGVELPQLASSWAAFVVHATGMLRPEGRLAMVLPMELWHASYAGPVVRHLRDSFARLQVLTFRKRLFPDISQDTVLLLGDCFGGGPASLRWRDLGDAADLESLEFVDGELSQSRRLDADAIATSAERLVGQFIPSETLRLYRQLLAHPGVTRLGEVARVGIGYVSGNNDFFHLSTARARALKIPSEYLRPAVRKGRALSGLLFTKNDWDDHEATDGTGYLLHVPPRAGPKGALQDYLAQGERDGVHLGFKCRTRTPWYAVPHVHQADGFLTYMSGRNPRLVGNLTDAVAPNNLHVIRMHGLSTIPVAHVAAAWRTSLTRLSIELEGHPMGGGMLKLEPREAERVAIPAAGGAWVDVHALDLLARERSEPEVMSRADDLFLRGAVGLTERECLMLRDAAATLTERRCAGGRR